MDLSIDTQRSARNAGHLAVKKNDNTSLVEEQCTITVFRFYKSNVAF